MGFSSANSARHGVNSWRSPARPGQVIVPEGHTTIDAKSAGRRSRNPKVKGRGPEEGRVPKSLKSEARNPKPEGRTALGIGFRTSDFGPRPSRFKAHPSPRPSTQRRGRTIGRVATNRSSQRSRTTTDRAPSPWGEGWGERELGRRTVAAAQYVFGTRETERQFLAASGANDRHAREPHEIPQAAGIILAGYALGHGHE